MGCQEPFRVVRDWGLGPEPREACVGSADLVGSSIGYPVAPRSRLLTDLRPVSALWPVRELKHVALDIAAVTQGQAPEGLDLAHDGSMSDSAFASFRNIFGEEHDLVRVLVATGWSRDAVGLVECEATATGIEFLPGGRVIGCDSIEAKGTGVELRACLDVIHKDDDAVKWCVHTVPYPLLG